MKRIDIELPPERGLIINGVEYRIYLSDFEILEHLNSVMKDCARLSEAREAALAADEVIAVMRRVLSALDGVLGEGAVKRILDGRPAGVNFIIEKVITPVLDAVMEEAGSGYSRRIAGEYGVGENE